MTSALPPYALYTLAPCRLHSSTVPAHELLRTWSLQLAVGLVRSGVAEPNDAFTAEAVELALRLRHECRSAPRSHDHD